MRRRSLDRRAAVTTISTRGQTVVPRIIRRRFGLNEGDRILWFISEEGAVVKRAKLEPEEPFLTEAEWRKLDRLVKQQIKAKAYTEYPSLEAAKKHISRLIRGR